METTPSVDCLHDTHFSVDEKKRLGILHEYQILDTPPEPEFDDFTALAAAICGTPIALISLLDEKRYWFKSKVGLEVCETPRGGGFCIHVLASRKLLVVEDALKDARLKTSPLVTRPPHIRFYADALLITPEGVPIGTLCVLNTKPCKLTSEQIISLQRLGRHVMALLELRRTNHVLTHALDDRDRAQREWHLIQRTLEQRVEERSAALLKANEKLRAEIKERIREKNLAEKLVNSLPGAFYLFDEHGKYLRWNQHLTTVLGYSDNDIRSGHPLQYFESSIEKRRVTEAIKEVFVTGQGQVEAELVTKAGKKLPYLLTGTRIKLDDKPYLCGMGIDISSRKHAEQRSRETEIRYRRVVELSPTAIFVGQGENCVFANQAAARLLGASHWRELVGKTMLDFIHPDYHPLVLKRIQKLEQEWRNVPKMEEKFVRLDGSTVDVEVAAAPFVFNREPARILVVHDISEAKRYQAQLEHQANHDALTGLPNRSLLIDRVEKMLAYCERHSVPAHVIFFDLDNFKLGNDSLGHNHGDALLCLLANRMLQCIRKEDTLARLGGDEFVLLVGDQTSEEIVDHVLPRMINAINGVCVVNGQEVYHTCSIGISSYPTDGADATTLLKHADIAMYKAKETGRNKFQFFTADMNEKISERLSLQSRLQRALERDEFYLHYQPKINLATGSICGAEVLLRWQPPNAAPISPATFISLAEETGLIVPIGEWVLKTACEQYRAWRDSGLAPVSIAVNCSPRQFLGRDFVKRLEDVLHDTHMNPNCLEVEVTEGAIMQHPEEAISILKGIKSMGITLSVDDFGTGYSSLNYLKRLPIDRLKIDQSFVRDLPHDEDDAAIVEAITKLGHSLGLRVTAEGVETEAQVSFLRQHESDEAQGYYVSRPLPANEFEALLRSNPRLLPALH